MAAKYAVRGARIHCTYNENRICSHVQRINLPESRGSYIHDAPMLCEDDTVPGENIPCFGICYSKMNNTNAQVTYAAQSGGGTVTGRPCTPVILAPWLNGKDDVFIWDKRALTTDSYLVCANGGFIEFENSGQDEAEEERAAAINNAAPSRGGFSRTANAAANTVASSAGAASGDAATAPVGFVAASRRPFPMKRPVTPMKKGEATGNLVSILKMRLNRLGFVGKDGAPLSFARDTIDTFDENTLSAVNDFKKAAKLSNNDELKGVVGLTTWDKLEELSKFIYNGESLKQGASNDETLVKVVQLRLRQLNFYKENLTGTFDSATTMAVNSFKDFLRFANTGNSKGTVDKETWEKLIKTSHMGSYDEPNGEGFIAPLDNMYVTAGYGDTIHHSKWHRGTDLRGAQGTPIFAIASGKILYVKEIQKNVNREGEGARGNWIVLEHDNTKDRSFYQHNDRNLVVEGQKVVQGQIIATVGDTGSPNQNHLHIELLKNSGNKLKDEEKDFEDFTTPIYHLDPIGHIPEIYRIPVNQAELREQAIHPELYGPGVFKR
jgi:murein DD-endopeptidase MepM/ murein hydrolase activator NlpD